MKCPECDSEVAKTDAFCPFCGISITHEAEPEPAIESEPEPAAFDPEMESTIMIDSRGPDGHA